MEGEEGATLSFPLSSACWASVFNLFLAWEDCTGEWLGASWTMGFKGGGAGKVKLGQPRCWEIVGWTIPSIHHLQGPQVVRRHEEVQGYRGLAGLGKEAFSC
jgi:hypothetical protein